jgi:hypothetical protein
MLRPLSDDELYLICGGIKNADLPGVRDALNAFYGVLFCGGSSHGPSTTIAFPDGTVGTAAGGSFPNCSPA